MDTPEQDYPIGQLAMAFPDMTSEQYNALKTSISEDGLLDPITIWNDHIIDGRHRYRACRELGVMPQFQCLPDDVDPARYVIARNIPRRNPSSNELVLIAHRLSRWSKPGGDRRSEDYRRRQDHSAQVRNDLGQQEAARLLGVSPRSVSQAARVLAQDGPAIQALQEAVEKGEIKVGDAYKIRRQPEEVQKQALDRFRNRQARTLSSAVEAIVGGPSADNPMPQPLIRYRTIVVDPPWPMGGPVVKGQPVGQVSNCSAMTVEDIAKMKLPLADTGFVFLWATQEHLPEATRILSRWKLNYRFTMVWSKSGGIQPPNSCRYDTEFIVVGTKGEPKFTTHWSFSAVITAPCQNPLVSHSAKPKEFYDLLSQFTPGPRLELPEDCVKHWQVYEEA